MKTFTRVIIILVAALLVSGATFAFGQSSQATTIVNSVSGRSGFEGRGRMQPPQGQTTIEQAPGGQPPAGFEGRDGGDMGGFNFAGIDPVLKNATIMLGICIVLIVVSLGWRALQRGNRKPKAEPFAL